MGDRYWPLEYLHTTRGWVETGEVFSSKAAAEKYLRTGIHPTKRVRYRIGEAKPAGRTIARFEVKL